jgi:hypothetical protein
MRLSSRIGLGIAIFALFGLAIPFSAAASEVTVQTAQVIPPGSSCAPLQVINVHPYIVDNAVHSFDVTVSDPAYVAVISSVGETNYTFRYISRWRMTDGTLRQHVDVDTTPIGKSLPISLTLLSAKSGQPVCLSIIRFTVEGTGTSTMPNKPVTHETPAPVTTPVLPATTTSTGTTSSTSTVSVVRGVGFGSLHEVCTPSGSLQLWFLLITLYLIGAAVVALREPTVPARPLTTTTLLLIVPALALLAFWWIATTCRGADWVPVVLMVIAIASLLAALWERESSPRMVELSAPTIPKQIGAATTPTQIGAPRVTNWGK